MTVRATPEDVERLATELDGVVRAAEQLERELGDDVNPEGAVEVREIAARLAARARAGELAGGAGALPLSRPFGEISELPAEPGAEIGLPVLPAQGQRTVPVYSSEAQMRKKAPPEWSRFVRLGMPALRQMLAGSGVYLLINPGGDLSTMLDPLQIAALPEVHPPRERISGDATVTPLAPGELPEDLLSPLREFCARQPAIRSAYAAEMEGRLAVGLLLDEGASQATVMQAAEAELSSGVPPFGMLVIDADSPAGWVARCWPARRSTSGRRSRPARGSRTARRPPAARS